MMWMMKKQTVVALVLLLLIPIVLMLGGLLFSLINPEIAAGHSNYVRNFHFLSLVKHMSMLATSAVVAILWLLVCFLVIRSKERSSWWLFLATLGPFGFAILAMLNDHCADHRYPECLVRNVGVRRGDGSDVHGGSSLSDLAYRIQHRGSCVDYRTTQGTLRLEPLPVPARTR